jgi:hypothetical protein
MRVVANVVIASISPQLIITSSKQLNTCAVTAATFAELLTSRLIPISRIHEPLRT